MANAIKIGTQIIVEKDLVEKQKYEVVGVEEFVSPQQQKGIKVKAKSLTSSDTSKYACILWVRDNVGINSKLGAFVVGLGEIDNEGNPIQTDAKAWIGRKFLVVSWAEKNRQIQAID